MMVHTDDDVEIGDGISVEEQIRRTTIIDYEQNGWGFYRKIKNLTIFRKFGIPIKGKDLEFLFIILFGPQFMHFNDKSNPRQEHLDATEAWEVEESYL